MELWRIIKDGYNVNDPKNLTRRKTMDSQLNATAKKAWDYLTNLFIENISIQSSRLEEKCNESDGFSMLDE
jgi:hypothetical protein